MGRQGKLHWHTLINKNHNHAELDGIFVTHRKGATDAKGGQMGVIPGNMRDGSWIVRGLGDPDSLFSCSHGAGRKMSRGEAKRKLDMDTFEIQMEGIVADVKQYNIDESPDAYKNFSSVMDQQEQLCEKVERLTPIINWKG